MRKKEKWENSFILAKTFFYGMEDLWDTYKRDLLIRQAAIALRNPIVFDNQVSEAYHLLPYQCDFEINDRVVGDHLIGISNIVLYIYKKKLYREWLSYTDFIKTLKSLQVLLSIPKKLNNSKGFKSWQFNLDEIEKCINWNEKLKQNNIHYLISKKNNKRVSVDVVWLEWYKKHKKYL